MTYQLVTTGTPAELAAALAALESLSVTGSAETKSEKAADPEEKPKGRASRSSAKDKEPVADKKASRDDDEDDGRDKVKELYEEKPGRRKDEEDEDPEVTLKLLRNVIKIKNEAGLKKDVRGLLEEFDVDGIDELKESKYDKFYARLKKLKAD